MQPQHKPGNKYQTWGDMGTPSAGIPIGSDADDMQLFMFETAAAMAAAAVAAASASSSPAGDISPKSLQFVDGFFAQVQPDKPHPASSTLATEPAKLLSCGFQCEGRSCRKMASKHYRRLVCPLCMPPAVFVKCATGCASYIHVGCIDERGMQVVTGQPWICTDCTQRNCAQGDGAQGDFDVLATEPGIDATNSCETECFNNEATAYAILRGRGFKITNSKGTTIQWVCTHCKATFPCKELRDGSSKWSCITSSVKHNTGCTKVVQPERKSDDIPMIRYLQDFTSVVGLQDYIEIMGASGEIRADQLYRSVQALFNVHVESNLLYRTAKNAEEEMFGKTVSDVLELEKMCTRVKAGGGNLTLVHGTYVGLHMLIVVESSLVSRQRHWNGRGQS
jgi:hypothetical protein